MRVSFYVPRPSGVLLSNLLGVVGLLLVVVAVALLAGYAWGLLTAGLILVGLCALAQNAVAVAAADAPAGASSGPPLKAVS